MDMKASQFNIDSESLSLLEVIEQAFKQDFDEMTAKEVM